VNFYEWLRASALWRLTQAQAGEDPPSVLRSSEVVAETASDLGEDTTITPPTLTEDDVAPDGEEEMGQQLPVVDADLPPDGADDNTPNPDHPANDTTRPRSATVRDQRGLTEADVANMSDGIVFLLAWWHAMQFALTRVILLYEGEFEILGALFCTTHGRLLFFTGVGNLIMTMNKIFSVVVGIQCWCMRRYRAANPGAAHDYLVADQWIMGVLLPKYPALQRLLEMCELMVMVFMTNGCMRAGLYGGSRRMHALVFQLAGATGGDDYRVIFGEYFNTERTCSPRVLIGMMQGSCVNMRSHHAGRDEAIELFHGLCARYNRCSDAQCPAAHGCHTYPIVKSYRNTINPSQWLHGLQFMTSNIEGTPQGSRFGASDPNSAHGPFGARLVSHQP